MNWGEFAERDVSAFIGGCAGAYLIVRLTVSAAISELKAGLTKGDDGFPTRREVGLRVGDVERRVEQLEAVTPRAHRTRRGEG